VPIPWHLETTAMRIRKVCVGPLENNVYIVACAKTNQAVVIDAADEADRLINQMSDVTPLAILTTHGHWDHVGAVEKVSQHFGVPFRLHPADQSMVTTPIDDPLSTESIQVGEISIDAVHTPGHTPGSTVFVVDGVVLTGDTLFPGGPGATQSPAAFSEIMDSLDASLFTLEDETLVLPGHGLDTTIGTERPSLGAWRARGW
jgi:glyoxylase-like metal-dependent hydrolase (beta-lactamase superfamily II)